MKTTTDMTALVTQLQRPFSIKLLKFKPQAVAKDKQSALLVTFIDARDVAQRLDEVMGIQNWQFELEPIMDTKAPSVIGTLKLRFGDEWISKSDVGTGTQGGEDNLYKASASDALKRCAVQFGVFRYAYDLKFPWSKNVALAGKSERYQPPTIPYAYLPPEDKWCEECGAQIGPTFVDSQSTVHDSGSAISVSFYKFNKIMCSECLRASRNKE